MKKLCCLIAASCVAAGCLSFSLPERYESGRYEGAGAGFRGPIRVAVETSANAILDIEVLDCAEDPFIGGEAVKELRELALDYNSTEVDAVSGATVSSLGFLEAVNDALSHAKRRP
jgi:fumarate reductase flavoprotein subunit